jgi:hypothetical protein
VVALKPKPEALRAWCTTLATLSRALERTLQRRVVRFEAEGMESLFGSEAARCRTLPPSAVSLWT